MQPSNASLSGAAKEAAQGLISSVGQGVNATQATLAATGVLGGLAANEAVSASLPGNDSMAKGAAKALGDAGSQGQAAEGGAATGVAVLLVGEQFILLAGRGWAETQRKGCASMQLVVELNLTGLPGLGWCTLAVTRAAVTGL